MSKQMKVQDDNNKVLYDNTSNKVQNVQVKFDQLQQKDIGDDDNIESSLILSQPIKQIQKNEKYDKEEIENLKSPILGDIKLVKSQKNTANTNSKTNDPSKTQINQANINRPSVFKKIDMGLIKMKSVENLSLERENSPKNKQQQQCMGDLGDLSESMTCSVFASPFQNQLQQSKLMVASRIKKNTLSKMDQQKFNMRASQIQKSLLNLNSNSKQVSRDDQHKDQIVAVNIPEIQEKLSKSKLKVVSTKLDDPNKLDAPTQEKFDRLISLVKEEPEKTWECVTKKDGSMFIYKKMIPNNPCVLVRAESLVKDCKSEEVFVQIYQAEIRSQWDKVTLGFTVIETIQEGVDVIYFYVDPGYGVTKRDFCQRRILKKDYPEKGQITIVFFSISHPNCPERKGYIRAHSHISGYVIRPVGNDTSITIMTQSDVKGSVPKYVVNFMAAKAPPKWIESMRKGCIDYRKSQNGNSKNKK